VELYGESPDAEKRHSPAVCIGAHKNPIEGNPLGRRVLVGFERHGIKVLWLACTKADSGQSGA